MSEIRSSRLLPADLLRVGSVGLRTRRMRAALSGVGVAIGIAAMVAVLGISESSKADLLNQLDQLGTNLLRVAPGQTVFGDDATLPETAGASIGRLKDVELVSQVASVDANVRRTDYIDEAETGGISVVAAEPDLPATLGATLDKGVFLNGANARYPTVVLGATAAQRLGITRTGINVWLADRWFTVIGILDPVALEENLDRAAIVGFPIAEELLGSDGLPTTVYVRADTDAVDGVRELLGASANPANPEEVDVSRPSDALAARAAAKGAFTALFLGLGAVALLVGGVGIANVMVIAVLERRSEIGLRRAIGATKRHIALQFLTESLLLAACGGAAGVALGAAVTGAYAASRDWSAVIPPLAAGGGIAAAIAIGAIAGLYPAVRAARLSPTDALRTV
jgi:putative ABC transport system permease protein